METIENTPKAVIDSMVEAIKFFLENNIELAQFSLSKVEKEINLSDDVESMQINYPSWMKEWSEAILSGDISKISSLPMPIEYLNSPTNNFTEIIINNELNQILNLYDDDKLSEAFENLARLRRKFNKDFNEIQLIKDLESNYHEIMNIFSLVEENEGWIKECSGHINVKYKNVPGTPTYSLLSEAEIDIPILHFLTLVYEVDLYPNWVPFCKKAYTVAKVSKTRKILVQEFHVRLAPQRHSCVYGYGANLLLSHGAVVIYSKSCDQEKTFKGFELPQVNSVRAHVNYISFIVRPLNLTKIHVTMLTNYDPNLYYVPYKILNFFSRKMAKGLFQKLEKLGKNFTGSEYEKRILSQENREFYHHIEISQAEYLRNMTG